MTATLLELENIGLSFTGGRDTFRILDGLDMGVEEGKITALVGGNGAGKTTLFNVISGFQKGFGGKVLFHGRSIGDLSPHQISRLGMGRLFQGKPLLPELTLLENMKLAAADATGEFPFSSLLRKKKLERAEKEKEARTEEILNRLFGANSKYARMTESKGAEFSYGEQRLLALAGLLMGDYSLLLLDEPTAGVNPVYVETVRGIIRRMVEDDGKTVLLIEHNMRFVREVADACVFLEGGKIAVQGATDAVLGNQAVRNSYLGID